MGAPEVAEHDRLLTRFLRLPLEVAHGFVRAVPRAVEDMFRDRCPQYAAAISFRVLFSLFPLTILLVSIFGLVLQDDELRMTVIDELLGVLPVSSSGEDQIRQSIESLASPFSAIGLVSLVALLWGASGMMASLRIGLEAALKVPQGRPAARAKLVDFILVGVSGLLVIVVIGISTFAALAGRAVDWISEQLDIELVTTPSGSVVREVVQIVLIAGMTLLLYRYVPAGKLGRRAALAGATFTGVGIWGAAKVLGVIFDVHRYNVIYGSLASVMAFLFFVYVAAFILLLGAEFAYAWSLPPGPPGPPLRTQVVNALKGLVVHPPEPEDEPERRDVSGRP
jgi:membrane protein